MDSVSVLSPKEYKNYAEALAKIRRLISALVYCESCDRQISESLPISHLSVWHLIMLKNIFEDLPYKLRFSQTADTIERLIEAERLSFEFWPQIRPFFI